MNNNIGILKVLDLYISNYAKLFLIFLQEKNQFLSKKNDFGHNIKTRHDVSINLLTLLNGCKISNAGLVELKVAPDKEVIDSPNFKISNDPKSILIF